MPRALLLAFAVTCLAAPRASAQALADLFRMAGPTAAELTEALRKAGVPSGTPIGGPVVAGVPVPEVRVTDRRWSKDFPLTRDAVAAVAAKAGPKPAWAKFSCVYRPGAAVASCDFAYDVWPEMCWYGFDHALADLRVDRAGEFFVTKTEWRAD
jgi:hypothetical protein